MLTELIDRLSSPTPLFFRKVRRIGLAIAGVGGAAKLHPNTHVQTFAISAISVGTALIGVASAAVDNDPKTPQ